MDAQEMKELTQSVRTISRALLRGSITSDKSELMMVALITEPLLSSLDMFMDRIHNMAKEIKEEQTPEEKFQSMLNMFKGNESIS